MTRTNTGNAFRFFYFDPYSVSRTVKKQKNKQLLHKNITTTSETNNMVELINTPYTGIT